MFLCTKNVKCRLIDEVAVFSQLLKVEVALSEVGVARPEGPCPLGGSGGMLPQEILKF